MGRKSAIAVLSLGVIAMGVGGVGLILTSRQATPPAASVGVAFQPQSPISPPVAARELPSGSDIVLPVPIASSGATATGAKPKDMTAGEQAMLAQQLRSADAATRQDAIDRVRAMAISDPRNMALSLPSWAEPMLDAKQYADVEKFAIQAINERPFDVTVVEAAQRARVVALIAGGNYPEALKQAKSYYNVAALSA
jgi:hypothetical protein